MENIVQYTQDVMDMSLHSQHIELDADCTVLGQYGQCAGAWFITDGSVG